MALWPQVGILALIPAIALAAGTASFILGARVELSPDGSLVRRYAPGINRRFPRSSVDRIAFVESDSMAMVGVLSRGPSVWRTALVMGKSGELLTRFSLSLWPREQLAAMGRQMGIEVRDDLLPLDPIDVDHGWVAPDAEADPGPN